MGVLLPCSLISVFRRITFLKKRGRRMINCVGWNLSRARGDGGVGGKTQGVYFIIPPLLSFSLFASLLFIRLYGPSCFFFSWGSGGGGGFIYFPCLVFLYLSQEHLFDLLTCILVFK